VIPLARALDAARAELRAFALGIHPPALTERGLRAALEELAAGAAVPVRLSVDDGPFAPTQAAAAYFVCSEALTNATKYASARQVEMTVGRFDGCLIVRVVDDGVGGADPTRGSGLSGLAARLDALGGVLRVESSARAGTRVHAEIPLGASA
jgi:signal transduction histidine kinase